MTRIRRSFSPEFKAEAVKLVVEESRSVAEVARSISVNEQSLRNWITSFQREHQGDETPLSICERKRLHELERENRELRLKSQFLGKAAAFFAQEYR